MTDSHRNSNSYKPPADLEKWLQLPESVDDCDDEDEKSDKLREFNAPPDHDKNGPSSDDKGPADSNEVMTLFPVPDSDVADDGSPNSETAESDIEVGQDNGGAVLGKEEDILHMENLLNREFGDTLAGANSITLPLGLLLLILAVIGWFLDPLMQALGLGEIPRDQGFIPLIAAVLTALGGIHLLFYWMVHRISNSIKSRELDRLIEERRINKRCVHLDCIEAVVEPDPETDESDDTEETGEIIDLVWRCSLFEVDVEELPICAVCDRYESPADTADESEIS